MRRISRIGKPIGLFRKQMSTRIPSTYLCLACKHRTTPFSTSFLRAAPSNEKASFTEKVRQKIWGTHQPPGLEDPYGDGSVFDRTKKREQRQRIQAREQEPEEAPVEVEETATEVEETETDNTRSFGRSERATNWDGLQWVGGGTLWQPEDDFKGFLPADATTDREHTTAALHRAMVEVFALQQAGKPLHKLSTHFPGIDGFNDWTDNVQLTPSSSGATVQMPEQTSLREVMESLAAPKMIDDEHEVEPTQSQEDISADKSQDDPLKYGVLPVTEPTPELDESTEFEEENAVDQVPEESLVARTFHDVISSWDPSWLQISLGNPEVKFAVLKRTMQLTGIRIPDAAIKSSNTAKALLNILVAPPKPRKLFESLAKKTGLPQLENVSIYPTKRTFYAKERDIGRLKVIKEALEASHLQL